MSIKLVAIDLDQTLLRADKTYDVERFEAVVEQLTQQGVMVCIATGNSYHKIVEFFSASVLEKLHLAGDNGNFIMCDHEVEKVIGIERQTFLKLCDYFEGKENFFICISTGEVSYMNVSEGIGFEKILKYNNEYKIVQDFSEIPEEQVATKIAIFSPRSLARNKVIAKELSDQFADLSVVTSGDDWVDAYHYEGGKGSAIQFFKERYQLKPEEVMAFGDSLNDESMMKEVKYSVAMSNADTDLALHCQYKIGSNEEQAVIDILERLVKEPDAQFMDQYEMNR